MEACHELIFPLLETRSSVFKNSFCFGYPIRGDYFLALAEFQKLVLQFTENRIHLVLIGPRRSDKTSFVLRLFALVDVECDRDALLKLKREVQNTPNNIQNACFQIVAMGVGRVTLDEIAKVLRDMVSQNAYAQTLLNNLTAIRQRSLRLAAKVGSQIFAKEVLERYEIPSEAACA